MGLTYYRLQSQGVYPNSSHFCLFPLEDEVEILEGNEVQDYFVDAKRGEIIVKLARST
jgi:hypothetical protein